VLATEDFGREVVGVARALGHEAEGGREGGREGGKEGRRNRRREDTGGACKVFLGLAFVTIPCSFSPFTLSFSSSFLLDSHISLSLLLL